MHLFAEVRDSLLEAVRFMRDTAADPEKIQGRLTKEDKVRCTLNLISRHRKLSYSLIVASSAMVFNELQTRIALYQEKNRS